MGANVNQTVTANAEEIIQGAGTMTVDAVDIGSFNGGIKKSVNQTEKTVECEYLLGPVDIEVDKVDLQIQTELDQSTLENIAWVCNFGGSSSVLSGTSSKVLDLTPDKTLKEHVVTFLGQSATNKLLNRLVTLDRVISIGSRGIAYQRGVKTVTPVTLRCLMNSSGSFGTMVDSTISE
jgi:hypothetical protein